MTSRTPRGWRSLSSNVRWSILLAVFFFIPLVAAYAFAFAAGVSTVGGRYAVFFNQEHENGTLYAIANVLVVVAGVSLAVIMAVGITQQVRANKGGASQR